MRHEVVMQVTAGIFHARNPNGEFPTGAHKNPGDSMSVMDREMEYCAKLAWKMADAVLRVEAER